MWRWHELPLPLGLELAAPASALACMSSTCAGTPGAGLRAQVLLLTDGLDREDTTLLGRLRTGSAGVACNLIEYCCVTTGLSHAPPA